MKPILGLTLALGYFYAVMAGAQCNGFYPMVAHEKAVYELLDRNGKVTLRVNQWFRSGRASGVNAQGIMVRQLVDSRTGRVIYTSERIWDCNNGTLYFILDKAHPDVSLNVAAGQAVSLK